MPTASSDGATIHYSEWGEGDQTLIFLPGLGMSNQTWATHAEALASSYRVLAIDPRGSGESDTPDHVYTAAVVAGDVAAVMDAAGVESAHLVGQSMGGMIAQDFAIAAPERVRSLTLVSTYAATDEWSARVLAGRRRLIEVGGLPLQFSMSVFFVFSPRAFRNVRPFIEGIERRLAQNPPNEKAYLRQIDYCLGHDATGGLRSLGLPAMVVAGAEDFITSAIQNRELAELIPGCRYEEFEHSSHGLIWEEPDRFTALLADFLKST